MDSNLIYDFDDFFATGNESFEWPNLDERSGAALCYTSGTTGNPKGVMYSHRSCVLETLMCMGTDCMSISGKDCILPIVPMFHALSWCTPYSALCLGHKYILYNCFRAPMDILDMMFDHRVTLLLGVPFYLNQIKIALEENAVKYESMRGIWNRAVCGGSEPPASMIKWYWDEWNVEIIHGWGMTETNPVGSVSRRVCRRSDLNKSEDELWKNQIPQGLLCCLVDAKIVNCDNFDEQLEWNGESMGELLVRGPTICKKYFQIDAKEKFHDGWLITGDIATIDADSTLRLCDRSKDLIKSGGEWISSIALENCIMGMSYISKAAVVGVYDVKYGERPVVVLEMVDESDYRPTLEEINEHIVNDGGFAKFQKVDDVLFFDIPLTGTGKMSKKKVREKLKSEGYKLPFGNTNENTTNVSSGTSNSEEEIDL